MTTAPPIPLQPATKRRANYRPAPKPESNGPARASQTQGAQRFVSWLKIHWLTILFCGGLLGAVLSYLAWTLLPSKYESYALLRVASSPFTVSNNKDPNRGRTEFATYLKTNAGLIKNEFVLNKALRLEVDGVRISDLPTIREQKNPFQFLEDELIVSTQEGSEIIRLTMKGHNPDDVRRIVNAVQTAYMEEVIEKEIKERQAFLLILETTLVNLQKTLNEKGGKVQDPQLLQVAGDSKSPNPLPQGLVPPAGLVNSGPPDWVKKQIAAAQVSRSLTLQEQVMDLPILIASQKAKIEYLKKRIEQPIAESPTPSGLTAEQLAAAVERDPEVQALMQEEEKLRREVALDQSRYSNPQAPAIIAKWKRAEQLIVELDKMKKSKTVLFSQIKNPTANTQVSKQTDSLMAEFDSAILRLQELEAMQTSARQKLSQVMEEIVRLPVDSEPLQPADFRKIDEKKPIDPNDSLAEAEDGIFRGLAQNAAALRLDLSSPKRVSVLQTASTPMQKDTRKQILATIFAGLLGFGFVGFIALGYEAIVQKSCTLADIQATLDTPIVAVIPRNEGSGQDPIRQMEVQESIDKLRTYVTQTWLPRGATTVAMTSAIADEGKSFTAFALANSMADAGYRTLLVDFDLRLPSLHRMAQIEATPGVCELLRGETDFAHSIKTQSNSLQILPAGRWTDDVRRVSGSERLEQLLKCIREPFDCVILLTHPLLTAAESLEVVRRSEVVLLCSKYRESTLPLLKRAADRVATTEVPYSGVVYLGSTSQEALC